MSATSGLDTVFVKLGGSLITDKTRPDSARTEVLDRVAAELSTALQMNRELRLVLGHGSGSFGHFAGSEHNTRDGVQTPDQWKGFARTASAAQRLNCLVTSALQRAGIPVWSIQPSASALCQDGALLDMSWKHVCEALEQGLVPLVYGDVALDRVRGGTIISTEEIFVWLARRLKPSRIILAGTVPGVFRSTPIAGVEHAVHPSTSDLMREITPGSADAILSELGGSHGTDVTGGMLTKVMVMCELVAAMPSVSVQIVSGEVVGLLTEVVLDPEDGTGTIIRSD